RECHRVVRVPAVQAIAAAGALLRDHERRAVIQVRKWDSSVAPAEIPCAVEIILGTSADDDRLRLIVNKEHVVSLSHPTIGVLQYAQRDPHQVAAAASLDVDVV